MNKPQPDDKLLLARLEDKARLCSDNSMITNSDFLDMHERSLVKNMRLPYPDVKCVFYGAFPDAERTAGDAGTGRACLPRSASAARRIFCERPRLRPDNRAAGDKR